MRPTRFIPLALAALVVAAPAQAIDLNPLSAISGAVEAVVEDRSTGDIATDTRIKTEFTAAVLDQMGSEVIAIKCDVYEQTVMLTGAVETPEQKQQAYRIIMGIEGVKRVYNDIIVIKDADKDKGAVEGAVDDTVIETKIKALFMDAQAVSMTNYRWRSIGGRVYLFGRALSQAELDKAVAIVKSVKNVRSLTNRVFVRPKAN